MSIDNSTSLSSSVISTLEPFIIALFFFLLGVLAQKYNQKFSNRREKAREILLFFSEKAKMTITSELEKITQDNLLEINYSNPIGVTTDTLHVKLKLNCDKIMDGLVNSKYFKKDESNHLKLNYTSNLYFNEYANKIIKYVDEYNQNIKKMNLLLNNVVDKPLVPSNFIDAIRKNIRKRNPYQLENGSIDGIRQNGLVLIFVCCLFGSTNSYQSGDAIIIELLKQKPNELKQSIGFDDKSAKSYQEIQQVRNEIALNLQNLNKTISSLCEDFQNKYDV